MVVIITVIVIHPVSLRRFPSLRTQPLESLAPLSVNKWVPEQPSPWRKYYKRESCYGDRVYTRCVMVNPGRNIQIWAALLV